MPKPDSAQRKENGWERSGSVGTYILEYPHFAQDPRHLLIVLALELVEHRVAVLALPVRRRGAVPFVVDAETS